MTYAREKAVDIAGTMKEAVVIGADTIVVLDDERLGKPVDRDDAVGMLTRLQGKCHRVITGICVIDTEIGKHVERYESSTIFMRAVTGEEINDYVDTGEPMDKAGAYAIQGGAGKFITSIEGSYTNIIGLPLELLAEMLAEFDIKVSLPGPEVMEFRPE
jgi:nucleoside triphosphate pyrophosphatase